jgi:branched-subunit amino acid aminotransferase/4-amino-4-deoxychorismate lyase
MFSTDSLIGVKPSDKYKFLIILSPTGPYYNKSMRIYVEEKYSRAAPVVLATQKLQEITLQACWLPRRLKS